MKHAFRCSFVIYFLLILINNSFSLNIKCFPSGAVLVIDNSVIQPVDDNNGIKRYNLDSNWKYAFLRAPGYRDRYIPFHIPDGSIEEYKLEKIDTHLVFEQTIDTGEQPKSVRFSPDGKYLVAALLNSGGIDVFSIDGNMLLEKPLLPEIYAEKKGFVETLFVQKFNELWVSQMSTGMIHIFNSSDFSYKLSFPVKGRWPKVLTADKNENSVFISNWESRSISVASTETHKIMKIIKVGGIPRGMGVTRDNRYLYVALYSSGNIVKIDLSSNLIIKTIFLGSGAPRHIVISDKMNRMYVSDMYLGTISIIDTRTDRIIGTFYVGSNLNTIALGDNDRYLFISSRGKNSKNGYLYKGPVFGKIFVYDTLLNKIVDWTWGGNQPTGLAVAPDGQKIAFTDFLDHRMEIYNWEM